jgi:hypothetical protein
MSITTTSSAPARAGIGRSSTKRTRVRMLGATIALAAATTLASTGVAHADAEQCGQNGLSGETCTKVVGRGLQVNAIKVRVIIGKPVLGHFQMFGTSFNLNTADQVYEGHSVTGFSWIDSGWHYPNKQVADHSYVCGRFWKKIGTHYEGFGPIECVKVHA